MTTIWRRLAEAPHRYPVPPSGAWSLALVDEILSNPKYTGHQVMGRRKTKGGTRQWTPASEWIWTPEPTHTALVAREVWDAAQQMGRRHGSARDPATLPRTAAAQAARDAARAGTLYNRDKHQLTIHATITGATPQAIRDLLLDPRAGHNQQVSDPGPTGQDQVPIRPGQLGRPPGR